MIDGRLSAARSRLGEALRAFRAYEMQGEMLDCLEDQAALAAAESRYDLATRIAAMVELSRERLGLARPERHASGWQAQLDALRAGTSASVFDDAWAMGRQWGADEAINAALAADQAAATV